MTITIQIKNNYGKDVAYPVCEKGKEFCKIAGTKTITKEMAESIEKLGFTIQVQQQNSWRG